MKKKFKVAIIVGSLSIAFVFAGITAYANICDEIESGFLNFFRINKGIQSDKKIAATVNGEPIYTSAILIRKSWNEMSNQNAISQIEKCN